MDAKSRTIGILLIVLIALGHAGMVGSARASEAESSPVRVYLVLVGPGAEPVSARDSVWVFREHSDDRWNLHPKRLPDRGPVRGYVCDLAPGRYHARRGVPLTATPGVTVREIDQWFTVPEGRNEHAVRLRIKPATAVCFRGRLLTTEDEAVQGACVAVGDAEVEWPRGREDQTDREGRFELGLFPHRAYRFLFWAPKDTPARSLIRGQRYTPEETVTLLGPQRTPRVFKTPPAVLTLLVHVAIEKPVAAAPLDDLRPLRWQRDKNGVISDFIRRKPGGFVAYDVPPGTYRVLLPDSFRRAYVLEGPDTGPMRVTADAALPVEKTLALRERRRAPLTVRVVDGESGAPISQAKVFVEDALGQTRRSPTDADGRVAFEAVPEGTLRLSAGHWTHETAERGIAHPHDDPLTVRLTPLPVIEGRLTSDGFDTFERMRILAVDRDSGDWEPGRPLPDGTFRIPYRAADPPGLLLVYPPRQSESRTPPSAIGWKVVSDPGQEQCIRVEPLVPVEGKVVLSDRAAEALGAKDLSVGFAPKDMPGWPLFANRLHADGRFVMPLRPGPYTAYLLWRPEKAARRHRLKLDDVSVAPEAEKVTIPLRVNAISGAEPVPIPF